MQLLTRVGDDRDFTPSALAHYDLVAPLIEKSFAGTPIVYKNHWEGGDQGDDVMVTPFAFSVKRLLWLVHTQDAIEFYTAARSRDDEDRLRFSRILLESPQDVPYDLLRRAAHAVRSVLRDEAHLEAIPLLDGDSGIALWIPWADAPHAAPLRSWLRVLAHRLATQHPDLVSTEVDTHQDGRVHLRVSSDGPGHYSVVPYSLREQSLRVCTPVRWTELDAVSGADAFEAEDMMRRLHEHGDIFAMECARLARQLFSDVPARH